MCGRSTYGLGRVAADYILRRGCCALRLRFSVSKMNDDRHRRDHPQDVTQPQKNQQPHDDQDLKPGWLYRQFEEARREVASWPAWMQREARSCGEVNQMPAPNFHHDSLDRAAIESAARAAVLGGYQGGKNERTARQACDYGLEWWWDHQHYVEMVLTYSHTYHPRERLERAMQESVKNQFRLDSINGLTFLLWWFISGAVVRAVVALLLKFLWDRLFTETDL